MLLLPLAASLAQTAPPPPPPLRVPTRRAAAARACADELDAEGGEAVRWLAERAARSRERRRQALLDVGRQLRPVERLAGWRLVARDGTPLTPDAWVFLAVVAAAQLGLLWALFGPAAEALQRYTTEVPVRGVVRHCICSECEGVNSISR